MIFRQLGTSQHLLDKLFIYIKAIDAKECNRGIEEKRCLAYNLNSLNCDRMNVR